MLVGNMRGIFGTRRASRRWISAIALFAFLFAQMSLAAYTCPNPNGIERSAATAEQAKVPCADTDVQQPTMCHEHCKDQAGVDQVQLPGMPSTMAMAPILVIPLFDAHSSIAPVSSAGPDSARVTEPPPSIRFCVFRT